MNIPYQRGLHDLGNATYAYLQPDGAWGWSNAGLITDGDQSLLVDTLFDLSLTGRMLEDMRRATPAAGTIDILVNTHANGDHCWGNQLVAGARILASRAAAEEMRELPPQMLAQMMRAAPTLGPLGAYLLDIFGAFDFEGIQLTPPTETFEGRLDLRVGAREVQLIEVGPAHTRGDALVYLPADRVLFTGDILFEGVHPIMWAGPVERWIEACDRILDMAVDVVVPGHGPVTDQRGVRRMRAYLAHLRDEARARYEAGMSLDEAVQDIRLDDYAGWSDPERVVANLTNLYRQLGATDLPGDPTTLFARMSARAQRS
jgi:cyclase